MFTLLAVSPFLAMRSAPTTAMIKCLYFFSCACKKGHTNGMDRFVLEERADHGIADHGGRDGERVEF